MLKTQNIQRLSVPPGVSSLSSSLSSEKPARSRAGFSFGNRTNGLKFVAQVIGLRGNGAMQRLSEHLPHSPTSSVAAAARPVQKSEIALPSSRIYKP